jgi:type I restriction enzyme S subunit
MSDCVNTGRFKETEIGLLPTDWEVAPLRDAATFTRKPQELRLSEYEAVPFVPMELVPDDDVQIGQYELKPGRSIRSGTYCEKGDILLAKITPSFENGKQGIVDDIPLDFAYATTEVYPLRGKPDRLDQMFLFYFLKLAHVRADIAGKMEGTTGRQRIPKAVVENYPVPLPPLSEQRRIAHALGAIQQAIAAQDDLIVAAREVKHSLLQRLFTYGPGSASVPTKETEVGEIPEHWEVVRLGEVATIGNGSTPKRTNLAYWEDGAIPWLTSGKVHERIIRHADEFVTELAQEECHLPVVRKGSIVVAITGQGKTLGNAALVTFDTCINQHLAYLHIRVSHVIPEFVLTFLQQQYEDLRQASQAGGSTKGALTCGFLASYPVPLPPTEEQREIARIASAVDCKVEAEEQRKAALQALFETMLHQLMTGQIRLGNG